jgi:hypothetical protein
MVREKTRPDQSKGVRRRNSSRTPAPLYEKARHLAPLRRVIAPDSGPHFRPTADDPSCTMTIWERSVAPLCDRDWYELTGVADARELSERLAGFIRYPWPEASLPVEWCVTPAGTTPATAEEPLLYTCLARRL